MLGWRHHVFGVVAEEPVGRRLRGPGPGRGVLPHPHPLCCLLGVAQPSRRTGRGMQLRRTMGRASFVSGSLVCSARPHLPVQGLLSVQSRFREPVHPSSRLCPTSPIPASPSRDPGARSGSAGQFPREWMVQKPSATGNQACCFPVTFKFLQFLSSSFLCPRP